MKTPKRLIDRLQNLITNFEENIQARHEYHDSKTEKWQESEKGELFSDETDTLQEGVDMLQEAFDNYFFIQPK